MNWRKLLDKTAPARRVAWQWVLGLVKKKVDEKVQK